MTNIDQAIASIEAALEYNRVALENLEASWAHLQNAHEALEPSPPKLLFGSPVTGKIETGDNIWGGDWVDLSPFGKIYNDAGEYHPSADLNRPGYKDSNAPVYAAADGEVVFSGNARGWQGKTVVIQHKLETGQTVWTRYAHLKDNIPIGQARVWVKRGDQIGRVGDYPPVGEQGDHVDYGVGINVDLGKHPEDWPGKNLERLLRDYADPAKFHRLHSV